MSENFTIRFWGVRGSHPAPGKNTVRYGGNTSCVEVRAGMHVIILDAGTGIIPLGQQLARERQSETTLLLSHLHHDHTQGFPFFAPAYIPGTHLHIYGPGAAAETLERVLDTNQSAQTFPVSLNEMSAAKDIRSLKETDVLRLDSNGLTVNAASSSTLEAVTVKIHRSYAHPGSVYVYRIEYRGRALVYATDTEGYVGVDKRLTAFARGADVLIHDAQYSEEHYYGQSAGVRSTQGFGHSTPRMACELAASAGARKLVLFHHEPTYTDDMVTGMEARARTLFPNVIAAYEGLAMNVCIAEPFANSMSIVMKDRVESC